MDAVRQPAQLSEWEKLRRRAQRMVRLAELHGPAIIIAEEWKLITRSVEAIVEEAGIKERKWFKWRRRPWR